MRPRQESGSVILSCEPMPTDNLEGVSASLYYVSFWCGGAPSFYQAIKDHVEARLDLSHGRQRTEVVCKHCGGHLGHVFDDLVPTDSITKAHGPRIKGQRYCINSLALNFKK